ncbi:MAG: hypothetical protein ACP5M4_02450 [Acidobacteriaceae bacterium]
MPDSLRKSAQESGTPSPRRQPSRFQRTQILGLILLALLILLIAFLRADKHALFAPGWWRIG